MLKPIHLSFLLISFLYASTLSAQINKNRKKITTTRITKAPLIDGVLDDDAWKNAEAMSNFVIFRPENGKLVSKEYQTEVKIVYNDDAIFISGMMLDPDPANIPMEFTTRDNLGQADFFLVTINPNDDGQNPFEFVVQSTGNQADSKVSNGDEDFNWSAVWDSAAKINEKGWAVEIKIPYSAIRFANSDGVQNWGFNIHRRLEKLNEQHTWAHIDNTVGMWTQYDGLVEGFQNIKPPTRLSLYPYASITTNNYDGKTNTGWSAGMDIKYGLTENFTLDATLIPDFSQTGFDNIELNLGPFEQEFSEQRQFFTEGVELFNQENLFYSRRIGGRPIDQFNAYGQLSANEEIIDYPEKVTMLNAIKLSGRTKKGLGIGFFNAITQKTEATVKNNSTNETRKIVTNPFSNYNIVVLDQQFNQNSSITLINTNVTRNGRFRDANVTGLLWHLETKDSKYNVDGSFKMSNISDDVSNPKTGYAFDTSFGENAGKWTWEAGYILENKDFDPNDLGILFSNNEQLVYGNIGYRILKPKGNFNRYSFNYYSGINFQHFSGIYTGYQSSLNFNAQLKSRFSFGGNLNYSSKTKDFFEPRQGSTSGIYFLAPEELNINQWGSTNYQKKLAIDYNWYLSFYSNSQSSYGFSVFPRYRFNNKFSLTYGFTYKGVNKDRGYVTKLSNSDIIFGKRDTKSTENKISGKYNFNIKSAISLSFRHFWQPVQYENQFYTLNTNGKLQPNSYKENHDINYNSWNLDVNYIWQINPGSQLIALYRNTIFNQNRNSYLSFSENLDNLLEQPNQHTFSLKLIYFLGYNHIKKIF